MKLQNFSILELQVSLMGEHDLNKVRFIICSYFDSRIQRSIFLCNDEKNSLISFIQYVKFKFHRKDCNGILLSIMKLLVLSYDYERYHNFQSFLKKKNGWNDIEILEYLDIVFKNALCCANMIFIQELCYQYLKKSQNSDKLFQLLNYYSTLIDTEKPSLRNEVNTYYLKLLEQKKLKQKLLRENKILINQFQNNDFFSYHFSRSSSRSIINERIITIDDVNSPDLDGAFSIQKEDNIYYFKVYVSNVPDFLKNNPSLAKEAYQRGRSFYIHDFKQKKNNQFDMLPPILSHHYLSLKQWNAKEVIAFCFVIQDGNIISCSVEPCSVRITYALTPQQASVLINSSFDHEVLQRDLKYYQSLCKMVLSQTSEPFLSSLNVSAISDLIAFPSILLNYYIGKTAQFAIYRVNGKYTKNFGKGYTHSVTPLRNFVSDINLAFYLEQMGCSSYSFEKLNYVEMHIDEILGHFNEREGIQRLLDSHPSLARKLWNKK